MARSINTDPFQNFRFHLLEAPGQDGKTFLDKAAGFMSINVPELTLEMAEYKTGIDKFKKKYPGPPSVADVTLTQGIFKGDSPLYQWVLRVIAGGRDYRRDLMVYHYHIQDKFDITQAPSRIIMLREAWPMSIKPNPDFEANSADVSIADFTLTIEQFEIINTAFAEDISSFNF